MVFREALKRELKMRESRVKNLTLFAMGTSINLKPAFESMGSSFQKKTVFKPYVEEKPQVGMQILQIQLKS